MTDFKIKPELREEWQASAGKNCLDEYSFGVVQAIIAAFVVLDADQPPKDADSAMGKIGIPGFMAGCCAQWISKYHERGEEFRKYWNEKYGATDQAGVAGVVNPAILVSK